MKLSQLLGASALAMVVCSAQANVVVFDDDSSESDDVSAASIDFGDFVVTAGVSTSGYNLAKPGFNVNSHIDNNVEASVYMDVAPDNGGLGAYSAGNGWSSDTDNLDANLYSSSAGDEVLFFNFDMDVVLDQVNFNGNHTETTGTSSNGNSSMFNIFYSLDGITYSSVFAPAGNGLSQRTPTGGEYLLTGLTSGYSYYAIAATGWNDAPGGYVESISYTGVPEPGSLMLLGLGLLGLVGARKRVAR